MNNLGVVDIGTQSPKFREWASQQDWQTVKLRYHEFADLPSERGDCVSSPDFSCLGHIWRIDVHPGGARDSRPNMVAVHLYNQSDATMKITFGLRIRDTHKTVVLETSNFTQTFSPKGEPRDKNCAGNSNMTKRSTIMNSLAAGTLIVEVRMKLADPSQASATAFVPENPFVDMIRQMFMDKESADVVFEVTDQKRNDNARKKAKATPVAFYAHRLILKKSSSYFAEMCRSGCEEKTRLSITDTDPVIFRHLLNYVYGGKVSNNDMNANAKNLIDAADKYDLGNLKLEAEACLVNSTTIEVENVMELLLYADAKNCALLKEAAMDFIVANKVDILQKVSFENAPGSMIRDVLSAMARRENKDEKCNKNDELSTMRIGVLRRQAHEKGLPTDGSREALIAALK